MRTFLCAVVLAVLVVPAPSFAQAADTPFQVRYATNLIYADSVVDISNSGASSTSPTTGTICANVYAFSPDQQMVSCCSCAVAPDGIVSLSLQQDLLKNTLTPSVPSSLVIKLLGTASNAGSCDGSAVSAGTGPHVLTTGLLAWGTSVHIVSTLGGPAGAMTETAFTPSTLSAAELIRLTTTCGFIASNGGGYGICSSCQVGGLVH